MADLAPLSFSIGKGDWRMDPRFHDFCSFLGLAERDAKGVNWKADEKTRAKLEEIYFWGSLRSKTGDHEDIKKQVHDLQRTIGVNWTGKTLVDRLWQHTTFDTKYQNAVKKLKEKPKPVEEEKKSEAPTKAEPAEGKEFEAGDTVDRQEFKNTEEFKERPRGERKSEPIEI